MHLRSLVPTAAIALAAVTLSRAALGLPTALGAPAPRLRDTADRAAAAGSGHASDGRFHNTLPDEVVTRGALLSVLRAMLTRGPIGRPAAPVPLAADPAPATPAPLALTWYGHSSVLLEVDGHRVLADPVWGERVSPSPTIGPRRLHPAPVPLSALPPVDAVVLSHDHYDHLDLPTVRALLRAGDAPFVVPLGLGNHLRRWGVPDARVVELDWDESVQVGGLTLTCTEARHFSGRGLRRNTTLWSSWVVTGPAHRAFFGGDTGYTPAFADLGARLRPVRPHRAADRGLQRAVAVDPHEPGGGRAGPPGPGGRPPGAAHADPLGDVQPRFPPVGGARAAAARGSAGSRGPHRRAPSGRAARRDSPSPADRLVDRRRMKMARPVGADIDNGGRPHLLWPRA